MSDISLIMQTDPLKLTREDVAKVVAEMRASRHLFNATPKAPPAKAAKVSKIEAAGITLDLGDLL